ncbi:MAG: histidine kinase [Bacteroidota bacterium]
MPHLSLGQRIIAHPHDRVLKLGDDLRWADPALDDSDWDPAGFTRETGNFWVRFRIRTDDWVDRMTNPGIQAISLGSFELYWDGVLIGKNGRPANQNKEEVAGRFISHFLVPDSLLQPGEHVVAFRLSNYRRTLPIDRSWNVFILEEYMSSFREDVSLAAVMLILAGVYLMASLYYLFLYLLRKRERMGIIFSGLCFLFFGLIVMEYLKFLYPYPYPFHFIRLLIIFALSFAIAYLTPTFFLLYFGLPHRRLLGILILILPISVSSQLLSNPDLVNHLLSVTAWWSSLAIVCYASLSKKRESRIILLVILMSGLIAQLHHMEFRALIHSQDITLFISFSLLVVSMMYLLARRAREQRQAYEDSLLLSARLQNELLKKNIQPHFIMNTLTSLMEWIEESPKDSVQFIEALSKEFEIMSEIAEEKLIPVEQEIALCQYHIELMKYRKEIDYQLKLINIQSDEWVPPAIFHTILENSITHSKPDSDNQIQMILSFEKQPTAKIYRIETIAENRSIRTDKEGTGFKYIKSRLEENYGQKWDLSSHSTPHGWLSTISIFAS